MHAGHVLELNNEGVCNLKHFRTKKKVLNCMHRKVACYEMKELMETMPNLINDEHMKIHC